MWDLETGRRLSFWRSKLFQILKFSEMCLVDSPILVVVRSKA